MLVHEHAINQVEADRIGTHGIRTAVGRATRRTNPVLTKQSSGKIGWVCNSGSRQMWHNYIAPWVDVDVPDCHWSVEMPYLIRLHAIKSEFLGMARLRSRPTRLLDV